MNNLDDILLNKWKTQSVFNTEIDKPNFCVFNNIAYAIDLLHEHIRKNNRIAMHTDVDVDGIGTTFILKRTLENLGSHNHILIINRDKVHGIQQKHVEYFNTNRNIDLIIITDSSSNEIDLIKQFECDVLCIDHHDLLHKDLLGFCNDNKHRYVIVNNNIENSNYDFDIKWIISKNPKTFVNCKNYIIEHDMSCALVVYELLRIYCECFGHPDLLENLKLYQWVGITLFTDVINTLNNRNQWYLNKTIFNGDNEITLNILIRTINSYKATLDKSFINYSFAPLVNKTIRAGESSKALDIIVNAPNKILDLTQFNAQQEDAINKATVVEYTDKDTGIKSKASISFPDKNIVYNIDKLGIHPNYCGVIASKLSGAYNKNAAVYITDINGVCKGSFRGRQRGVGYRQYFEDYSNGIYAQGHPEAFGFRCTLEQLTNIMKNISEIESNTDDREVFSIGNIEYSERGINHIDDILSFKRAGGLFKLAIGNSKVNSRDEIRIKVNTSDITLVDNKGKLLIYNVLGGTENGGFQCKAFKAITSKYCYIYLEYSNEIELFLRQ